MTDLNAKYREEGWGKITDAALGIEPKDVESQARDVARWADAEIARLTREKDAARGLLIVERTIGDHFGVLADAWRDHATVIAGLLSAVVEAAQRVYDDAERVARDSYAVGGVFSDDLWREQDHPYADHAIALREAIAAAREATP